MSTAGMFYADIRKVVLSNTLFHRQLYSVGTMSLVVMNIPVGGEIGFEAHAEKSQYTEIIDGTAEAIVDGKSYAMSSGHVMIFPPGVTHNVRNVHPVKNLKLYSVYSYNEEETARESARREQIVDDDALFHAVQSGDIAALDRLLKEPYIHFDSRTLESALEEAAEFGYIAIVDRLLEDKVDPMAKVGYALRSAFDNGHTVVVDRLLQVPRVQDLALYMAAEKGHLKLIELLLKDSRIDPTAHHSVALRWAARFGHFDVVKALLDDGRADPSAREYEAVHISAENKHYDVVDLLMQDPRVNASDI